MYNKKKLKNIIERLDEDNIGTVVSILEVFLRKQKQGLDLLKENSDAVSITLQRQDFKDIIDYFKLDTSQTRQILKNQWNRDIC